MEKKNMESHIHRSFNLFVLSWAGPLVLLSCLALTEKERERDASRSERNNSHPPPRISFFFSRAFVK